MFRRVRGTVSKTTEGLQRPRTDVALVGEFFLTPSNTITPTTLTRPSISPATPPAPELNTPPVAERMFIYASTGINYQPLRDALAAISFIEANEATRSLMPQAVVHSRTSAAPV